MDSTACTPKRAANSSMMIRKKSESSPLTCISSKPGFYAAASRTTGSAATAARAYRRNGEEWSAPIAEGLPAARLQTGSIGPVTSAPGALICATAAAMRGFFLADPDELSLLAYVTKEILARGGAAALCEQLGFFGIGAARLLGSRSIGWEDDPWARGG